MLWLTQYNRMQFHSSYVTLYFAYSIIVFLSLNHTHTVLSRGRSHSPCYRFLSHWGDWIWVRSKSHMIFNGRSQLPEAIVIYTWIVR